MKIVIGTVCIAAGAFAAYWAFRVWRFKQALDAFGQDVFRGRPEQSAPKWPAPGSQRPSVQALLDDEGYDE